MEYEIRIRLKEVGPGDVTHLAQEIVDNHGDDFDFDSGEMIVTAHEIWAGTNSYNSSIIDWEPTR